MKHIGCLTQDQVRDIFRNCAHQQNKTNAVKRKLIKQVFLLKKERKPEAYAASRLSLHIKKAYKVNKIWHTS
jgi:hypothetical protein